MAYSELIKNFGNIRSYMREFYVYGFKNRGEFTEKSARSYDNERRRIESWLGECMNFSRTAEGKRVFISMDCRKYPHNPLYKAWKTKSFTNSEITLHFILFDIFATAGEPLSIPDIMAKIDRYLDTFPSPMLFDESTVRKKLREYVNEGFLLTKKVGNKLLYEAFFGESLSLDADFLNFFSEISPCGVVGSFLLDKLHNCDENLYIFKHHYITHALDSEILATIFLAMRQERFVTIENLNRRGDTPKKFVLVPLQILISVQNGRQYLVAAEEKNGRFTSFRLDYIISVKIGEKCGYFGEIREVFNSIKSKMWGVICREGIIEKVEFTIHFADDEQHIYRRLLREKRCGKVTLTSPNTCVFSAEVCDTNEMLPWIRSFICRISNLKMSNKYVLNKFRKDLQTMYKLYGIGGDKSDI